MSAIHLNPAHRGLLHEEMGIPKGKKISIAALMKKKAKDKKEGDVPAERRDVFALNAKTKFHH